MPWISIWLAVGFTTTAPATAAPPASFPPLAAPQEGAQATLPAPASEQRPVETTESESQTPEPRINLQFHGYGDLRFAFHNFGPDQSEEGGAPAQRRAQFDATRFAMKIEGDLGYGFEFEVETEFEHGGVGSSLELEYEEFGEYEYNVEQGGEIVVEELYLSKGFGDWLRVYAGRLYVPIGYLPRFHWPTHYAASTRPESERTVLPAVWAELGFQIEHENQWIRATAQLVNGLDSSGFSSQRWIASGRQLRFETNRATDPAVAAQLEYIGTPNLHLGVSAYRGNTTNNRPKPDMAGVRAPVTLVGGFVAYKAWALRAHASAVWGHLQAAGAISQQNRTLSNNLDVLRSEVADQALSAWGEVGLNVFHWSPRLRLHRLETYARIDYYDTMFKVSGQVFDNPRFERTVLTAGLGYQLANRVVSKIDVTHRRFGTSALRPETTVLLMTGFAF